MKKCLLKSHNHLSINSCLYSFDNFFLTSYLLSFLETLETCGYSAKLLYVSRVFFFFFGLNSEKVQKSCHTNTSNNNTKRFLYMFCDCCMIALGSVAVAIADYLCHIKK